MNDKGIPPIVLSLALQVNMTPIAWVIHPDRVVIVFEQGPKLTFERELTVHANITNLVMTADAETAPAPPPAESTPKKKGKSKHEQTKGSSEIP